jgi:WD40 repeat protein
MAMLVGCSRYLELPGLPAVPAGLVDLQAALTDSLTGGFTPGTCQVIAEPGDGGGLARVLLEAARATEDTLLVYYAGHGVLDEDNKLHLALTGTSSDQALVPDTALAFDRVRSILRTSPARNRIVILDCCFAGRAIHDMAGPDLSAQAVITGSYVLTATDADKTARASDGARHTAFTGALLGLLHTGIPEGPDLLTLEAIYPHLRQALFARGLPEPRRQGTDTAAGLALARNRTPRPALVPDGGGLDLTTTVDLTSAVDRSGPPPDARWSFAGIGRFRLLLAVALVFTLTPISYGLYHAQTRPSVSTGSTPPPASSGPHVTLTGQARILAGHTGTVTAVAFAPDGGSLATTSNDATVRVWDAATGKTLMTLTGHTDIGRAVAYAPDGKTLATASNDKTVRIWDAATGKTIRTLTGHTDSVHGVAYAPDGKTLATTSTDKTARIWDPAAGKTIWTLTGHDRPVRAVAYTPDGKTLATTSDDKTVRIWDPATGKTVRTLTGHDGPVWAVAYAPDGKTLATAGADKTVRIWDLATGKTLKILTGHADTVTTVAYAPDGKTLASSSDDETVRIWDPASGKTLKILTDHTGPVDSVAYAPDGKTLATTSKDKTVRLWPLT